MYVLLQGFCMFSIVAFMFKAIETQNIWWLAAIVPAGLLSYIDWMRD